MKVFIFAFVLTVLCLSSCSINLNKDEQTANLSNETANADLIARKAAEAGKTVNSENDSESEKNIFGNRETAKTDCTNINTGEKTLLKSQTFPINFAPFKNSCFVTAHDPEYTDPPLNSEFSIYRNGEEMFFFPGQFNGVTTGCWVEAVSFQDLNNDNLTDIIVVGKCGAKSGPYHENMVYVNTGTTFITDENANYKLADFEKAGEISNFVKRNKQIFF